MQWHDTFFHKLYILFDLLKVYRDARAEARAIADLTGIGKEDPILEVCCGYGRQTLALAELGYTNLTGIDKSEACISEARRQAAEKGMQINFVLGDVLKMTYENQFKLVLCVGTSFGYYTPPYEPEENNLNFLRCVHTALRPGGVFLLEQENTVGTDVDYSEYETVRLIRLPLFDPCTRIYSGLYIYQDLATGQWDINVWRIRLYTGEELTQMLRTVGFEHVSCYGGFDRSPYLPDSRRLIVVAHKAKA
jgi:SAM-dependent methyltransferase